jgi:hypothetical protein
VNVLQRQVHEEALDFGRFTHRERGEDAHVRRLSVS